MEKLPTELKENPIPLVMLMGYEGSNAKENHEEGKESTCPPWCNSIKSLLQGTGQTNGIRGLHVVSVPWSLNFRVKKELYKEKVNSAFSSHRLERNFDGIVPQGILKTDWLKKHHQILPSVVGICMDFDITLGHQAWYAQESRVVERLEKMKKCFAERECKVIIILMLMPNQTSPNTNSQIDDRLSTLRKRTELDSKSIVLLRDSDIAPKSTGMEKLEGMMRSISLEYYRSQAKRVKRYKKNVNRGDQLALHVRHSFKIAHYYEFRQQADKMLKHYDGCYKELLALPLTTRIDEKNTIHYEQVRTMAENVNFKLCYHYLLSINQVKRAVSQFHLHVSFFRKHSQSKELYDHWGWLAEQYQIFAEIVHFWKNKRVGDHVTDLDSANYADPFLYYNVAAKYTTLRRKYARESGILDQPGASNEFFFSMPKYFGGLPPNIAPKDEAIYRMEWEKRVKHNDLIVYLLQRSLDELHKATAAGLPRHRHRNRLLVGLGSEQIAMGKLKDGQATLLQAKEAYSSEYCWGLVARILQQLIMCASKQKDTTAYIDYSLQLLSPKFSSCISKVKQERVQLSLLDTWTGICSSKMETNLSFGMDYSSPLLFFSAKFLSTSAVFFQTTLLELFFKSNFPLSVQFSKIIVCFSDCTLNYVIDQPAALSFQPGETKKLNIEITVNTTLNVIECTELQLVFCSPEAPATMRLRATPVIPDMDPTQLTTRSNRQGVSIPIVKPTARASISGEKDVVVLTGEYKKIIFTIHSNDASMSHGYVSLQCSDRSQPFLDGATGPLYVKSGEGRSNKFEPLLLNADGETFGPLPIGDMAAGGTTELVVYAFSPSEMEFALHAVLKYTSPDGIELSKTVSLKVMCIHPLTIESSIVPDFSMDVFTEDTNSSGNFSWPIVSPGRPFFIYSSMSSRFPGCLSIDSIRFEQDSTSHKTASVTTSGILDKESPWNPTIFSLGDQFTLSLRVEIHHTCTNQSLGAIKVCWRRQDETSDEDVNHSVETLLALPTINAQVPSIAISFACPPKCVLGQPFIYRLQIKNNTTALQELQIVFSSNSSFMLAGMCFTKDIVQPHEAISPQVLLVPLRTGYVSLPSFQVSPTPKVLHTNSQQHEHARSNFSSRGFEIFVMPAPFASA